MNSPTCRQCDCVKGCQSNPVPCPNLLAECIKSGQVSAAQIEAHRVLDAAICTPTQAQMLRNLAATMLEKKLVEQPEPVSQPLTSKEIQEIWKIWESQVFPIIDLETDSPIAQLEQPTNTGELHFPLMCKAFRTTVSQGLDKRYEMVFAFPDLTALHAANTEWLNFRDAAIAQSEQPDTPMAWQLIDDDTPRNNKRMLYLARFELDGRLKEIDFDGTWECETGSWEMPENYWYWASAIGIEEPTHWAYQDEALPAIAQPEQKAEPVAWAIFAGNGNMRLWSCKESYVQAQGDELGLPLVPLYDHPAPVRQPLTTEEIGAIHVACGTPRALHIKFARSIEARHGITTLESKK